MMELKKAFMDAYDNNRDGRIDIRELAQLLPIEESFKLVFNFENKVDSSVEFMRVSSSTTTKLIMNQLFHIALTHIEH